MLKVTAKIELKNVLAYTLVQYYFTVLYSCENYQNN